MRRRLAAGAVTVTLAAVLAGCTSSASATISGPEQVAGDLPADAVAQMEAAATTAMSATGASGMLVGVWAPWSGEWVTGLGSTAPDGGDPVTTDMTFRAGELTRAMTCDALYRLADRGTVSLDDSITKYVAAAPTLTDVTLVDLCNSTSGIGSASDALSASWLSNPTRQWDPRELMSYGIADADLDAIGTAYRSSDAGYMLLGAALEKATGMRASEILAEEVFEPLGMSSTELAGAPAAAPTVGGSTALPGYAVGTDCSRTDATVMSASTGFTDSGVVTSLEDAATYVRALAFGALRPEGTPEPEAYQPYDGAPSWLRTVGGAYRAGTMVGQVGSVQGYTTAAFADEVSGLTVVVVLNASGGADGRDAAYLAWQLAAIASKAAPADGQTASEAGLPWTAQQFGDQLAANAICPVG